MKTLIQILSELCEIKKELQSIASSLEQKKDCKSRTSTLSLELDTCAELIESGKYSINEVRAMQGLPPIESGDEKLIRRG